MAGSSFSVLTFNAWLVPTHSLDDGLRLNAMGERLARCGADVICLQEMWRPRDRRRLRRELAVRGYPYAYERDAPGASGWRRWTRGLRGVLGNGLLTLSRYPLREIPDTALDFAGHSTPREFFMRKGCLGLRVEVPDGGAVEVYNTHLGSVRFDSAQRRYNANDLRVRAEHLAQLTSYLQAMPMAPLRIVAGDFNLHHLAYDEARGQFDPREHSLDRVRLERELNLRDAYHELLGEDAPVSFDPANHYVRTVSGGGAPAEHLDYVYCASATWRVTHAHLALTELLPSTGRALSDHAAVMAKFSC